MLKIKDLQNNKIKDQTCNFVDNLFIYLFHITFILWTLTSLRTHLIIFENVKR
jgi:hypothetical protein